MSSVMERATAERNFGDIVETGRVHSAYYSDEDVFEAELKHIFYGYWVYVGHESEIPNAGDYQLKEIGRLPVIMARDKEGGINVMLNRCRHRGVAVANQISGNTEAFRCIFHAWTYRIDGKLLGVPLPEGYGPDFKMDDWGLLHVPRMGAYRGFVFASLNPNVVDFDEYLGPAKPHIDAFCEASPLGKVQLTAGTLKSRYLGNWKSNGNDGYHPAFLHRSVGQAVHWADPNQHNTILDVKEHAGARAYELGNGHVRLATEVHVGMNGIPERGFVKDNSEAMVRAQAEYQRLMREAYGDKADQKITDWDPHMHVFPNLRVSGSSIEVLHPRSAGVTDLVTYPAPLAGVPKEINTIRLRGTEWFNSMGGVGVPDDLEAHRRSQIAHRVPVDPWVLSNRGLNREQTDPATGQTYGMLSDEQPYRGFAKHWKVVMSTPVPELDHLSTTWAQQHGESNSR